MKAKFPVIRQTPKEPVYIRLPHPITRCPYTGMSRAGLADISVPNKANNFKPPVRSIYLKKDPTVKRAVRLIDYRSLMNYLGKFGAQGPGVT
jgi:hypothetical protein